MADAARATRREKVEARERAILSAARAVFEDKGWHGARMADIAAAAGVSDGALYTYFPNKEALLRAVLDQFWAGLTDAAQKAAAGPGDVFARLEALAARHMAICLENFDFIELSLIAFAPRARDRETRAHMRGYVAAFDAVFRSGVDRGVIRPDLALWLARDQFYGALEYSARSLLIRGGGDPDAAAAAHVGCLRRAWRAAEHGDAGPGAGPLSRIEARLERLERGPVRPSRRAMLLLRRNANHNC